MIGINRNIWIETRFNKNKTPNWPCPTCFVGTLLKQQGDSKSALSADGHNDPDYYRWHPEEDNQRIGGVLSCSNSKCKESVAYCGKVITRTDPDRYGYPETLKYYVPLFFEPPLQIFQIHKRCPEEIKTQLIKSFSHFFSDFSASANSMRIALEILLNQQKINKTYLRNNKRKTYTLHQRIEFFGNQYPELKSHLLAAKWIGNAGSHFGDITRNDLLDGYELLQHCIYELYEKKFRERELQTKAKSINKRRKPESTKKNK